MDFTLSRHAEKRREERSVSSEVISDVIDDPDEIYPDPFGEGVIYEKRVEYRGLIRLIKLAVDDSRNPQHVITIMVDDA
ncbi:MAG TPA: hypothetical protein VGK19_12360 [Capsulimonadaceae bacterium]|jgi:hypothetical protein